MNFYRQSIILFGIVLPALAAVAVIGVGYVVKSKITASYQHKLQHYSGHEMNLKTAMALEAELSKQRPHFERWQKDLSEETASTVTSHLRSIATLLPAKEYQQTAFDPSSTASGFGSASAQNASQLRIAFRGTYRTMQRAFLELETRMPQLQLQELKIDPSQNQNSHLNFQVTYTSWEN